jgi:hypothetical protein
MLAPFEEMKLIIGASGFTDIWQEKYLFEKLVRF